MAKPTKQRSNKPTKKQVKVRYGDTWEKLAKVLNVSVSDLVRANKNIAKPVAGMVIKPPKFGAPPVVAPGTSGTTSTSTAPKGTQGGTKYKQDPKTGQYYYLYQDKWLPTVKYDAWKKTPDDFWFFNPKTGRWEGGKGKPKGPAFKPGKTPLPYGGNPPPNWGTKYQYMLDPEKGTYYYWSTREWKWKVGRKPKQGGAAGGGGTGNRETPPTREDVPPTREEGETESQGVKGVGQAPQETAMYGYSGGGIEASPYRAPLFGGPTYGVSGYGVSPTETAKAFPSYIGTINWRF